jgi:Anti-sigma factor NepR
MERFPVTNLHTPIKVRSPVLGQKFLEPEQMPEPPKTRSGPAPRRSPAQQGNIVESELFLSSDPIGAALKRMHDAIVKEPVPDDFLALLDDIDSKIAARKSTQ